MLSFDGREASRQERYRDLVYGTAELVSRNLPVEELLESAIELGKSFFSASFLEINLRDAEFAQDDAPPGGARTAIDETALAVLRTGASARASDDMSMHVPVRFGSEVRGVISIARSDGAPFDDLDASLFEKWALLLGVRIHELYLRAANARLEVLAGIDGLTGIHNRRAYYELLGPAWARAAVNATPLAIAMIDVDFFKSFNDKYGHVAGDACLKQIAGAISMSLRAGDVLGRYGGEEFAVFFEGATLGTAIDVAERLRENISDLGIPHLGSRLGRVTASIGVAAVVPSPGDEPSRLLERADAALYEAKAHGRNRVVAEAYVSESSAALPRHDVPSNLPTPISSFCGRHDDAGRVRTALADSRLVTVTGFGGVGKTRLVLEVARELAAGYRDGAWFVDLAGTRDGGVIPGLVASVLEIRVSAASNSAAELAERCRQKTMLLVLDNCEHLKADCAQFAAGLLRAAPHVRILATSREPLDTPEEVVVGLLPFALPESGTYTAREALRIPAVRLFADRAHAVSAFELDDANVAAVIDLCRRVDGIALGIELAAARLKMLSLDQLRGKLDERFGVLARKGNGVARQQTLRALIDWSFDLLASRERALFARLGIFEGSFTLEAATAVCGDDDAAENVFEVLDALVDKSLLVVETRRDDQHTFRMFASIRSYARDRLASDPHSAIVEGRHRDYFVAAAAASGRARSTADWAAALRPLEYSGDDLRAVLEATLGRDRHTATGAALAANLVDYWQRRDLIREGRAWLECALKREDASFSTELRVRVRIALMDMHAMGDARADLELAAQAAALLAGAADDRLTGEIALHFGKAYSNVGDTAAAGEHLTAALHYAEKAGDALTLARASNLQGILALFVGDGAGGVPAFTRSDQLYQRLGRASQGVHPVGNLAEVAYGQGRFEEAIALAKRALASAERSGDRGSTSWLLGNLGAYYLALGDSDSAASFTRDAVRISLDVDDQWQALCGIDTYARIAYERGDPNVAALLLGYTEARLAVLRVPRQPVDHERMTALGRTLRLVLGSEPAERRLQEGAALACQAMLELVERGPLGASRAPSLAS